MHKYIKMEDTKHLECPGINISESTDQTAIYTIRGIKQDLETIFKDTAEKLQFSQWRMDEEFLSYVKK